MDIQNTTSLAGIVTLIGLALSHFIIVAITKKKFTIRQMLSDAFSPKGVILRHRYWFATWLTYGTHLTLSIAAIENPDNTLVITAVIIASVIMTLPVFFLVAKRFRTWGKSGLWAATLLIIPIAPIIIIVVGLVDNRSSEAYFHPQKL